MASRLLSRSKTLALALSCADVAAPSAAPAGARWLRTLSSLTRDPAVAAAPAPRQSTVGSPLGLSQIPGYEHTYRLSGTQVLPRWFSTGASNGSSAQQGGAATKVTAFSPLEASIAKPRSGPLTSESSKVRRSELLTQATFYMIPTLLLVSKNSISTSLLEMGFDILQAAPDNHGQGNNSLLRFILSPPRSNLLCFCHLGWTDYRPNESTKLFTMFFSNK
ncbi:hypothetical protein GUJ93_ZPchr0001g30103 [Zizania palustris]|uniref:Uncharacterized protein n=1 Tax=Zizania palustris TaxID=103762 RepID=A0A8J5RV13_ZIZPA|nr:hypothetical protein GUJ93_ZPchr0001g30103 [Zizania palustris]